MFSNIQLIILFSIIIIVIMIIIRKFYLKYTKSGKEYISDIKLRKDENIEKKSIFNKYSISDIFTEEVLKNLELSTKLIHEKNNKEIYPQQSMQFECIFTKQYPFELLQVSNSFLELIGVSTFENLLNFYFNKRKSKMLNNDDLNNKFEKINFEDIFKVNKKECKKVTDILNEKGTISVNNARIELNTDISNAKIKVIYNLYINDSDKIVVQFNICKIKPKILNPLDDDIDTKIYKNIMHNIMVDLSFPIIVVDCKGIKFVNKCACDWFDLPYFNENKKIHMHDIFDKIDLELVDIIKENIKDQSNQYGFYKEYILEDKCNDCNKITIKNIPKEIIIQAEAFYNTNNKKELFISIRDSTNIHSYISENNNEKSESYVIDRSDPQVSEYIKKINTYNNFFKNFFANTRVISFGRINIDTRNIVLSNELFEEIIKYDKYKERYIDVIENIINEHNSPNIEREDNLYIYDITYNDRVMKLIYTYNEEQNAIDILIIENYFGEYLSNHSLSLLKNIYNTSDKPIIIVNKKTKIISMNDTFKKSYYDSKKQIKDDISLLDLVPETDKNKVKRAISDAIKFNSYNLKDIITITTENGSKSCQLQCLKSYGKIDKEEFIIITIFPIKDN